MSILPTKKTSLTSYVEENWLAKVAMLLKFTTIISPLVGFVIAFYILIKVVIGIGFKEVALMDNPFKLLGDVKAKARARAKRWG
jgi:hypothetical protein